MKKIISKVSLLVLLVVFLCPTSVFAQVGYEKEILNNVDIIIQHVTVDGEGVIDFNESTARQAGVAEELVEIGLELEKLPPVGGANVNGTTRGLVFPVYGNWCGPGYGEKNGDPIDILDAACKTHDLCYGSDGYFNCDCDWDLLDRIDEIEPYLSSEQKGSATLIAAYFTVQVNVNNMLGNCD